MENLCWRRYEIAGGSPREDACPIYERVMNVNESEVKSNWFGLVLGNLVYFFYECEFWVETI